MRGKCWSGSRAPWRDSAFNEARALCAGNAMTKLSPPRWITPFNEARALCAGNDIAEQKTELAFLPSMRSALCAREMERGALHHVVVRHPSMRPALCAREMTWHLVFC